MRVSALRFGHLQISRVGYRRVGGVIEVMVSGPMELYEKHALELCRFASTLVGPSGSDDLVSAVFVRLIASDSLTEVNNPRAYLFRAVLNEARSQHRSTQRRLAREAAFAPGDSDVTEQRDADVLRALAQLSVRQRAVLWLAYWVDAPVSEIGSWLGLSTRTVERELRAGKRVLEEELA